MVRGVACYALRAGEVGDTAALVNATMAGAAPVEASRASGPWYKDSSES
jgi:hypothetical protein